MTDEERAGQGAVVRRAVLGDAHVDRAVAATTPFTAPFQDLITRYAWGEIWSRRAGRQPRVRVAQRVLAEEGAAGGDGPASGDGPGGAPAPAAG